MARIPEPEINEIRAKANIVDVVGKYIRLQRSGKDYLAVCPFHDDHSPSMHISPDKQMYKCFVCGAGGNVFTFVQNYENVSFPEAVENVAEIIGYELSVKADQTHKPRNEEHEKLYKVLNETIKYTMFQLNTDSASNFRSYLERRGIDAEHRTKFEIGYNPGNDVLYAFLKAKGFEEAEMVKCNVVRTGSSGIHDVFTNRITFPIHDLNGNPVGFSARTLDAENQSKYINTSDSELYQKSYLVYNAHRAKNAARRSGCVYICEGVTDVIAFDRAGIENAVCTLGTSCTDQQIQVLKKLSSKLIFCYDGDHAGQHATYRAAKMAISAGCIVSIVNNQTGKDPDEIIRDESIDALKEMLKHEESWMEFLISYLSKEVNLDNYLEKKEFVKKVQAEIDQLEDEFDKKHFTEVLSKVSGLSLVYEPKRAITEIQRKKTIAAKAPDGLSDAEEQILTMMMNSPHAIKRFEEKLGYLTDPVRNNIAMLMVDAYRSKALIIPSALVDYTDVQEEKNLITKLAQTVDFDNEFNVSRFDGAIRKVLISVKTQEADAYRNQLSLPMNVESRMRILSSYQDCLKELRRYIDEDK